MCVGARRELDKKAAGVMSSGGGVERAKGGDGVRQVIPWSRVVRIENSFIQTSTYISLAVLQYKHYEIHQG